MEDTVFVTVTGAPNYYGKVPYEIGRIVKLEKDKKNEHDSTAIAVTLPYIGTIGYVANSVHTVYEGTYSAARLYDKFENQIYAQVLIVTHNSVILRTIPDSQVQDKF